MSEAAIGDLIGKTMVSVSQVDNDELRFTTSDGERFRLYHYQDCCESVEIEDVIGDLSDLVESPILMAEEVSHECENPEGVPEKEWQDSWTWTFYKLATVKGYVTIRWYGESNGYYSERVAFEKCED